VKKVSPELPVVFITGFAHFRRFFADKTARADGFLEKPFSLEAIDTLVRKYL
jgi:DNA-binding NtrC family response regulator